MRARPTLAPFLAVVLLGAACGLPRDPEGTSDRVRDGVVRVGVIENPPWASLAEGVPRGVEVALARRFAAGYRAEVRWIEGTEAELVESLVAREIDLVIGGLESTTPYVSEVGLTRPYILQDVVVGVEPGTPLDPDLEGVRVAYELGRPIAPHLDDVGAVPVPVDDIERAEPPVATDEWRLPALGLQESEIFLIQSKHVMAVQRGENGFMSALERFLIVHQQEAGDLLLQEARRL